MPKKKETPQQRWAKKNRDKLAAACRRWRKRHPERQKAAIYRWRQKNRKDWNAYQRRWRRRNRKRTNRLLRSFRRANREILNAKRRLYRKRNLRRLRAVAREYYRNNQTRKRIEHHNAMAKRKKAVGRYTVDQWRRLLRKCGYRCAYCGRPLTNKSATADHLVPLSRGGTNWIGNIVPACLPCNQRKNFLKANEYRARLKKHAP